MPPGHNKRQTNTISFHELLLLHGPFLRVGVRFAFSSTKKKNGKKIGGRNLNSHHRTKKFVIFLFAEPALLFTCSACFCSPTHTHKQRKKHFDP